VSHVRKPRQRQLHTRKSDGGIRRASYEAARGGRADGNVGWGSYPTRQDDLAVLTDWEYPRARRPDPEQTLVARDRMARIDVNRTLRIAAVDVAVISLMLRRKATRPSRQLGFARVTASQRPIAPLALD
jgi:hypothetical protein